MHSFDVASAACLEIWVLKCRRIIDLSDSQRNFATKLLLVLGTIFQKKDYISSNGYGHYSNPDISSLGYTASPLAFDNCRCTFWNCAL